MKKSLPQVISVDEEKCVNCHVCISVCPVKYCIDGSGEHVSINHDLCIGCGSCISACTHKARSWIDDSRQFFAAVKRKEPIIAVVAPAAASVFPGDHLRLNGFLKSLGIEKIYDVSFGAELTVKSYLYHLKENKPKAIIAQPCPAIVTYVEIYRPELLDYLAPADSPMTHTMKLIREYHPEYKKHKIAVISPCLAKKREYQETSLGDYNVTFLALKEYLEEKGWTIKRFQETPYDTPPAERAVLFSSPGGLMKTVERESQDLASKTRKIEGPRTIYPYLDSFAGMIKKGINPPLLDCLNCEMGCNGGPGTGNLEKPLEELEYPVEKRSEEATRIYKKGVILKKKSNKKSVAKVLDRYWKKDLYNRSYANLADNFTIKTPNDGELKKIYHSMHKYDDSHLYNCASCGYNSCLMMAKAIFNGLNKPENCHYFQKEEISREHDIIKSLSEKLNGEIVDTEALITSIHNIVERVNVLSLNQYANLEQSTAAVTQMIASISNASKISVAKREALNGLVDIAKQGESDMTKTVSAINGISSAMSGIGEMINVINGVASNTNLLSMNAAIEAAHAGSAGRGFAVVASEIRRLAETTSKNSVQISQTLANLNKQISSTSQISSKTGEIINGIIRDVMELSGSLNELIVMMQEMNAGSSQITEALHELKNLSGEVKDSHESISSAMKEIQSSMQSIRNISDESVRASRL